MPLYEYVCKKCSHAFEELVFGDTAPVCPSCDSTLVERVLSVVSVGHGEPEAAQPSPCAGCRDPRRGACGMG